MKKENPWGRVEAQADAKMMARMLKETAIEQYNEAVEKGASKEFLNSLYKQVVFDLKEFNEVLGELPGSGLEELKGRDE